MESQEINTKCRWFTIIKRRLWITAGLLFWDVVIEGFYAMSMIFCPLWFLISLIKSLIRRPGWRIAVIRLSMPILTLAIAVANGNLQWKISDLHAEKVIKACEDFHTDNGRYPTTLDELVPKYLSSVPHAKYCMMGNFMYICAGDEYSMLIWSRFGFYRQIYNFGKKQWSNLD